ncbi:hypothetical protein PHLCEN_2v621 [Hermanssonia centrifuga]|uniref:Uncharacterized protein n=1 Tax=Hermanssonia centrifuga TaxID=98765 RepID=A0A2R6S5L0_9APHY|nr:hypothetical protein PHLCEN_2v621 [Hermanssonia centrifuga]
MRRLDALVFYTEDTPTSPSSAQPPHTFDEPSLATQGLGYEDVPLPDIPPLPGRPTPWLSDGEVTVYLRPLYLRGWNLVRVPREKTNSFVALEGKFYFKTDDDATEFVSEARSLMVKLSDEGTLALTASEISYRTHTTFAIPPVSSDKGTPFVAPGVTLHDIRIALMIQQIREKCEPIDGGLPLRNKKKRYKIPSVVSLGMHLLQMPTNGPRNKEEESKRGSQPRCLACGKKHVLKDCPNRDDHKPRSPCVHCGGYHWDVDCPQILPVVLKDPFSGQDHVPDASGTCL